MNFLKQGLACLRLGISFDVEEEMTPHSLSFHSFYSIHPSGKRISLMFNCQLQRKLCKQLSSLVVHAWIKQNDREGVPSRDAPALSHISEQEIDFY